MVVYNSRVRVLVPGGVSSPGKCLNGGKSTILARIALFLFELICMLMLVGDRAPKVLYLGLCK